MRLFYTILFYLALPFILLRLWVRSRKLPAYRQRVSERFGMHLPSLEHCIWVHAVSVGETIAAIPLIKKLKADYPGIPLLVTNMTPTGAARVKAAFGDTVIQVYIPYDIPLAVNRFLERLKPKIAIIMETELWPNLFFSCHQRKIPIVIVNARLSEKSARGYRAVLPMTRQLFTWITHLNAQSKADADRFQALGLSNDKITVTGNIKFDLDIPADLEEKRLALQQQLGQNRLVWIAASTHAGEEELILQAAKKIKAAYPNALLILVPRHPDRFDAVFELIKQQQLKAIRRSSGLTCDATIDVYLGDTMGELLSMYSAADVAFVGGSFANIGGHNLLEPAAFKKPILSGPVLFNFSEISQLLLAADGLKIVHNPDELAAAVCQWFVDNALSKRMGQNAFQVVTENRGALLRQVAIIERYIA